MGFRDDREALRARAEALESEASDLREQLERTREALEAQESKDETDEAEIARLRKEVDALRRRAGATKPAAGKQTALRRILPAAVLLAVAGAGAAVYLAQAPAVEAPKPAAVAPGQGPAAQAPVPPAPARQGPLDVIRFGAVVTSAQASTLSAGDGCVLEAELAAPDEVGRVRLWCDGLVYDSRMDGGMEVTMHEAGAAPLEIENGNFVYNLTYRDTGTRTGPRPQILIDSQAQSLRVWREDVAEPFDLRLYIEDRSAPHAPGGEIAAPSAGALAGVHLRARGSSRERADCELRVHAEAQPDCRVLLRCGEQLLYGANRSGYNDCRSDEETASLLGADDTNGTAADTDPELHLDVPGRRLALADGEGGARWQEEFRLEEDPRCSLAGSWLGRAHTGAGEMDGVTLAPATTTSSTVTVNGRTVSRSRSESRPVLTLPGGASGEARFELECRRGAGAIVVGGARYEGRFGPGFATFIAERAAPPEERTLLWLRRTGSALPAAPAEVDLSAIPPAAREEVRRALERARR